MEAISRFFDPEYADYPVNDTQELLGALRSIVNGLLSNHWKKINRRGDRALTSDSHAADQPTVEDTVVTRDIVDQATEGLLSRIEEDELATAVLLEILEGNDLARDQSTALDVPIKDIYAARRRLKEHSAAVRMELEQLNES